MIRTLSVFRRSLPMGTALAVLPWLLGAALAGAQDHTPGIEPLPSQPRAETAFVLEIDSVCCSAPARIADARVEVVDGVIRVDTETVCGPLAVLMPYDYSVVVPPLPAGEYQVEVRTFGSCNSGGEPELTETVTVANVAPLGGPRCMPGVEPAATLLFPYFEVDPTSLEGVTTLLAITNTRSEPVLANVTLWSHWALPVASFEVYLDAAHVQTLNLRDVLAGRLPVTGAGPPSLDEIPGYVNFPHCDPVNAAGTDFDSDFVLPALRGERVGGLCWGVPIPGDHATGFVTVDVVQECSDLLPGDGGYFEAGGVGVAGYTNALVGDYFLVEPDQDFAQGERAVHLVADPATLGPGDSTFYRDLAGTDGSDARRPLGRVHAVRFLENPGFDGGTELLVWRSPREAPGGPVSCDAPRTPFEFTPAWLRGVEGIDAFDEDGEALAVAETPDFGAWFRLAADRFPTSVLTGGASGWFRLDLQDQSAVAAWMRGLGRFSVGVSAGQLDDPCGAE